jgi:probable F420-dependent oxidoreductase
MMRFGVVIDGPDRDGYLAAVRRAEDLGYDTVLCSDHLELEGRHFSHFAPIPALTAAAVATERIRVGTAVLNQDLRHPAVLAREAASLDVLSGGRLELGIGAGWNEPEYVMAGIHWDQMAVRVRRFTEYIQVVKGVIAEPSFSFAGEFFTITEMPGEPAPIQRPHPPIMIGAIGPKLLALAAREADIVSINMLKSPDPSEAGLAERVEWVREAASDRFGKLELQLPLAATLPSATSPADTIRNAAAAGDRFISMLLSKFDADVLAESPMILTGSQDEMTQRLGGIADRFGIGSVMIPMPQLEALAPVVAQLNGVRA